MCHRPEQITNSIALRRSQYRFQIHKIADHIVLRQSRYRGNDRHSIISSPTTNSNSNTDSPNPPLINPRIQAMGILILTIMSGGIIHPNRTIMVRRVPLLGTTEPLNALDMARPTKVVGVPQFAQTGHFSVILEIVENVSRLTMSGGKFGPLLCGYTGSRPGADFANK